MTDEQIERVRADVGRRWGRLAAAVEDAAVEVDAEGQNGNVVRQAFEDTRATVEAEIDRLTALVRQTREEADAAVQRSAEGELAARTEVERLTAALDQAESSLSDTIAEAERGTTYRIELQRTIDRLTARLQTAELRIRGLASDDEPPTPADLEAVADLCRTEEAGA